MNDLDNVEIDTEVFLDSTSTAGDMKGHANKRVTLN